MAGVGGVVAAVGLVLAAGGRPVAAQMVSEEACTDANELIRYLVNEGAIIQVSGLKEGVDSLANAILVRNAACGTPGDDSSPTAVRADSTPTQAPAATAVAAKLTPRPDTENSATRRDACLLVSEAEVGAAMKQGVVANESDPFGDPVAGVEGCEFDGALAADGATAAYTTVIYFQAEATFVYDAFHSTAEANGVLAVPGLGDRAFIYVGQNGPGIVVSKADKLFTMEFSGIGGGSSARNSLLVLARQAVGRVH
jgi:hypothetical protein